MALTPSHRNQVFTGVGHVVDENIEYSERPGKNHRKEAGRLEPCSNCLLAGKLCLSPGRHCLLQLRPFLCLGGHVYFIRKFDEDHIL